jgi:hypothetical protein
MSYENPNISGFDTWSELLATPPQTEFYWNDQLLSNSASIECLLPAGLDDENNTRNLQPTKLEDFSYLSVRYPGEWEDRALTISNLHPDITRDGIYNRALEFGDVESASLDPRTRIATVRFFDLRAAYHMRASHFGSQGQRWVTRFAPPAPVTDLKNPPNNGTIVLFRLKPGTTDAAIYKEFAQYGAIRQVRSRPDYHTQRFIEFWDARSADKAIKATRGKIVLNSKVSVDFSLPGGYRKRAEKQQRNGPRITPRTGVPCMFCY